MDNSLFSSCLLIIPAIYLPKKIKNLFNNNLCCYQDVWECFKGVEMYAADKIRCLYRQFGVIFLIIYNLLTNLFDIRKKCPAKFI